MAVDTRNRRASCLGFVNMRPVAWPNPDGTIAGQADRQHIAFSYPGILASGAATATVGRLMLLGAGCWLLWILGGW